MYEIRSPIIILIPGERGNTSECVFFLRNLFFFDVV